jgi:hypothetical protein
MQLTCEQVTDVANNRSTINWTLSVLGGTSSYYQTGPTTVTIAGSQVYYCKQMAWDTKVFPAARGSVSGSLVVDHDATGNKTIAVSMSTSIYTGIVKGYSGNWSLDGLPRQATITVAGDFTDVGNPSISFSNPGGFKMDVWLEPNPVGDHLCVRENIPNTGSYTWVLTDAEREALRNKCAGKSCTIRIGLYSYVGGVQYADYKDKTYIMTENAATKPSVGVSVNLNNSQLPSKFAGMYIQGKSRLNISLSAQGKHNASIRSYWAVVDGKTYSGQTITTDAIQVSGNVAVVGYAKDSREFTGSGSAQVNFTAYSKPLVVPIGSENAILCYRSDGNGNRVGGSTSVWIKAKRSYYSLSGKNTCALQWRRKLTTEEWDDSTHLWQDLLAKSATVDEYNALLSGVVFDVKKAYTVQIRSIDDVGESDTKTLEVATQDVALHLGKGGKNVAVGTYCDYSEDYTFYSAWKAIFDKEVYIDGSKVGNHVVEEGIAGAWKYRKWNDGTAELWSVITATHHNGSILGGSLNYPFTLTGTIYGIGTLNDAGGNSGGALPWNLKLTYGLDLCEVWVHNSGSVGFGADTTVKASVYIVGRWK